MIYAASKLLSVVFALLLAQAGMASAYAQEPPSSDIPDGLELGYVQIYLNMDQIMSDTPTEFMLLATVVFDMDSNESAEKAFDEFIESLDEESSEVHTETLRRTGDEAQEIWYETDDATIHLVVVREDDILLVSMSMNDPNEFDLPKQVVSFVLDAGPSDEDPVVDAEGVITGGWAEAFPQPDDIDALNGLEPAPVGDITSMGE